MASIGTAYLEVRGDYSKVDRGAKKKLGGMGKMAGAAIGAGVAVALKGAITEAREAYKVGKQTAAVIKSTGGAAKVSAKQVEAYATALSMKSGIDDEAIQSGQNLLLTFKNIRNETGKNNDIFNQASSIIVDMSVGLKTDLKSAAILAGKALNDPVRGLTALQRVGVTFTEGQKKQIKSLVESGNTMKAQKIILRELNSEFKGSAEAQADPFDKFNVAVKNVQESIGTALLPSMSSALTAVNDFIEQMQTGKGFGGGLVRTARAAFDKIKGIFSAGISSFFGRDDYFSQIMGDPRSLGTRLASAIQAGIQQANIGGIIAAAIKGGGGGGGGGGSNGEMIAETILDFLATILDPGFWIRHIGTVITIALMATRIGLISKIPILGPALESIGGFLLRTGWSILRGVGTKLGGALLAALKFALSKLGWGVAAAFDAGIPFIKRAAIGAGREGLSFGMKVVSLVIRGMAKLGSAVFAGARKIAAEIGHGMIAAVGFVASGAQGLLNTIGGKLSRWVHTAWEKGLSIVSAIARGIAAGVKKVASVGASIGRALIDAAKSALGIHSPSREFEAIGRYMMLGLAKVINPKNVGGFLVKAFGSTGKFVKGLVKKGFASVGSLPSKFAGLFGGGGGVGNFEGVKVANWIIPALKYARKNGWQGHVTSGWRSQAEQDAIRAREPRAAKVSNHTTSGAIDVGGFEARGAGAALNAALAGYKGKPLVWGGPVIGDWGHFSANGHARGGKVMEPSYIAGEEAPRFPEYILSTNPRDRSRSRSLWMQAAGDLGITGFKKSGKKKGTKKAPYDLKMSRYAADLAAAELTEPPDDDHKILTARIKTLKGREKNILKALKKKGLSAGRKKTLYDQLAEIRGQRKSDADALASTELGGPDDGTQSLAEVIANNTQAQKDLAEEQRKTREAAMTLHTATKGVTDTLLQGIVDKTIGGQLSTALLTTGARFAT